MIADCALASVEELRGEVRRIVLTVEPAFSFAAGQYVYALTGAGTGVPLSVASSPDRLPELELHFRPVPGNEDAARLRAALERGTLAGIDGPFGDVRMDAAPVLPTLMIAGGTGVSQARSMLEFLAPRDVRVGVQLVWGVASADGLYLDDWLDELDRTASWFRWDTVIDRDAPALPGWIASTARHLDEPRVLLMGPPPMVYAVADALAKRGVASERMASDAFTYAPR